MVVLRVSFENARNVRSYHPTLTEIFLGMSPLTPTCAEDQRPSRREKWGHLGLFRGNCQNESRSDQTEMDQCLETSPTTNKLPIKNND